MLLSILQERLELAETLEDNSVGSFAIQLDFVYLLSALYASANTLLILVGSRTITLIRFRALENSITLSSSKDISFSTAMILTASGLRAYNDNNNNNDNKSFISVGMTSTTGT